MFVVVLAIFSNFSHPFYVAINLERLSVEFLRCNSLEGVRENRPFLSVSDLRFFLHISSQMPPISQVCDVE